MQKVSTIKTVYTLSDVFSMGYNLNEMCYKLGLVTKEVYFKNKSVFEGDNNCMCGGTKLAEGNFCKDCI